MASDSTAARNLIRAFAAFGAGALALHGWRLGLTLLGPAKRYRLDHSRLPEINSEKFRDYLSIITDASVHPDTTVEALTNGAAFYRAELDAIRNARSTVNLEAYEFLEGAVTREFLDALTDRAAAGVEVRVIVDAIGSWGTRFRYFDALRAAGGCFSWYHPVRSKTWPYLNHRTHRKLLVVDGRAGFIGGAGFADHWLRHNAQGPPWRDTVLRIEGSAVATLNGVFAAHWMEVTHEILAGDGQFPFSPAEEGAPSLVVDSTPHSGATRARVLFQALIEAAKSTIHITTPYFVPDRSARRALESAARRGVALKILTAGPHNDHAMTHRLSRMLDHKFARCGAEVFEYQPSMIHAKLMTIDGVWTIAGSTNFDHRSFALNSEVNIAIYDRATASRIDQDFARDLERSRRLNLRRDETGLANRIVEDASWVLRREQ